MPYKIYTYEDPYRLDETDFWDEISALPHFCVARTLVNGLKAVMQSSIRGLLCPLDDLINREEIYADWTDNISRRVHQYGTLTAWFKRLLSKGGIDDNFYLALCQNQTYFLDALRLFIELGIPSSSFDRTKGNREQRLFVDSLREMERRDLFRFPPAPDRETLRAAMVELAGKELADYCRRAGEDGGDKGWYERAINMTRSQELKAIVVHGVHQFSPVQLRLLTEMEQMGVAVIFLFNYQTRFDKIYSSWTDIYHCFDAEVHHDTNVAGCRMDSMPNRSRALAFALGGLCSGQYQTGDARLRKWYQLYKDIPFLEFANITEYAHDRHFLSYPIGQFFSAIYRLWDYERGEILIDIPALKECLSSNILRADRGERLLRTFYHLEILFETISTYSEFQRVFASGYLENYDRVAKASRADACFPLRQISIYNQYKVKKRDIQLLVKAIEELNGIAAYLFVQDNGGEDFISFGRHFQNLEDFLKRRELTLATEEERALCERGGFLRYALFYGLCFNYCDVRLSYVRQYGNEITEPYAILSLLGLAPAGRFIDPLREPLEAHTSVKPADVRDLRYDRYQMMDMFLCPYRYFLDYVVSDAPIIHGQFLCQKYYENILIEAVWKQTALRPLDAVRETLDDRVRAESGKLRPFFLFWKDTEIYDLETRAKNYLLHDIIGKSGGGAVRAAAALLADTGRFLNQSGAEEAVVISSEWCTYCVHKGNCMRPFLTGC